MPHIIEPPSGHKRVKCPGCLATIGYSPNEVKERHGKDISGGPDGDKSIICPNCGKKIILEAW